MVKYKSPLKEEDLNHAFGALSDPLRRRILVQLAEGDLRVTDIAKKHKISLPGVSKHLKVLEKAKFIDRKIEGRVHTLRMNPEQIKKVGHWMDYHQKFWSKSFTQLKNFLER